MDDKIVGFKINSQGYGTIPKLAMQDRSLSIGAKAVYAYFCSYTGAGDSCFPSRDKICYDLDITKDTLARHIKKLRENGYIKVELVKDSSQKFLHNLYILCDVVEPCPKKPDTEKPDTEKPDTEKPDTEKPDTENLDTINNNIKINNFKNNSNNSLADKPQKERKRFVKPTVREVSAYCEERGNNINPVLFVDFYERNGWMVGKNKMVDWKAAVRTWECRQAAEQKNKEKPPIYDPDAEGLKY